MTRRSHGSSDPKRAPGSDKDVSNAQPGRALGGNGGAIGRVFLRLLRSCPALLGALLAVRSSGRDTHSIMGPSTVGKTLIFIPTYEERDNVGRMVAELVRHVPNADILFMDDNSPDGTGELLDELAKTEPRLTVIHRAGKLGVGGAHLAGIEYAYLHGYDTLVTLDCDFTHSPSDIPTLLENSLSADLTIGSRYLAPDSLPGWNVVRKVLTKLGHALTVNMLGIGGDATGAFRVYRLTTIPSRLFDLVKARGYAFFFESLFIASQNGLTIREVPIRLPARTYGHSKMNVREIRGSVQQLLDLYLAKSTNPAQFRLAGSVSDIDPALVDPQGWDAYWKKKQRTSGMAYEVIAAAYRNLIIKKRLNSVIRAEFPEGAKLLHAGCGSGQVDVDLHDHAKITAIDISVPALEIYARENPKASAVKHASIFDLPFPDSSFDGAYNLGVAEHFDRDELRNMFAELHRVIRPGGKFVAFWPHAYATSVAVLNSIHWVMNDVLKKDVRLHPPEVSLVHSKNEARKLFEDNGFDLVSYRFGPRDMFVQSVVVGERRR
jgi:dolichol-phosphate mannosyltransferase